jgi:hypothetical protein
VAILGLEVPRTGFLPFPAFIKIRTLAPGKMMKPQVHKFNKEK